MTPTFPPGWVDDVLGFWFETCKPEQWFKRDDALDETLRRRFLDFHSAVAALPLEDCVADARTALAATIVLDQFSRNMFRDTAEAFAADPRALDVARAGIELGVARLLGVDERSFMYLPLMHSEEIEVQETCVKLFEAFVKELSGELRGRMQRSLDYAIRHRDVIARFNRFPHRNAALGRVSTEAELVFLSQPGSRF